MDCILINMMRILDFGKYLKEIRGQVSQKDFAKIIGVSQNHLSNLENGKREPTISLLLLLAEKKGIPLDYWFRKESASNNEAMDEYSAKPLSAPLNNIQKSANIPDFIVAMAQARSYLSNLQVPIQESDRRILSEILAACQRIVDNDGIQKEIKVI